MAMGRDEFVISGMSCRLPKSDSIAEFQENLFTGVDMLESDVVRYNSDFYGLPKRYGKCKNITKFDANFFGINSKQAAVTDPQVRLLLETTYEALIDAGFRTEELSGSNTGVFVGSCESDAARIFTRYVETIEGYTVTGCSRSMFANRISFTFNFKGPSYVTDTACSSSLVAFHMAMQSLKANECDMALVLGANLCLIPEVPLQLFRIGMLGKEGVCRAFDAKGEGYVRSDGIVALVLQRRSDARRIYAEIVNSKTSTDGFKEEGITFPSGEEQAKLLEAIYKEAKLDPLAVSYVEAHGTGTPVGDPQELQAIASVLCKDRPTPLLVGSVKSNMGHAEPASGAAGLVKVLLSIKKGMLPANLNFEDPNPDIPSLMRNDLKIVAENCPFPGEYVGINSFGFGGSNVHVILKKPKDIPRSIETTQAIRYPMVLLCSGRTTLAVSKAFEYADEHRRDPYLLKMLNQIANISTRRNQFRGYKILHSHDSTEDQAVITKVTPKKQLWFVFTGMGAQWFGMGESLMKIPAFQASIAESAEAVRPLGINLLMMIQGRDQNGNRSQGLNNIMEVFVLLIGVQIGIVDLLEFYGIQPAGIIGHSVGEIVAAYADGTISKAQAILIAYYRAKAIMDGKIAIGKMLAVGMTDVDCQEILKPYEGRVVIACQNTKDALTLSGPAEDIDKVAETLNSKGIFCKAVDTFGIAFHSPLMAGVAEDFRKNIEKIITKPLHSSGKWISTSLQDTSVDSFLVDSEYFVNNLVATVQFHSALKAIQEQSLVLEIGPNGILQTVIKRGLSSNCSVIDCMRANEDNSDYLLSKIGEIFLSGIEMQPAKILDKLNYPVPLSTPMLNSSLEWDHSVDWPLEYEPLRRFYSRIAVEPLSMDGREESTYVDHIIDGRNLFPLTGYIYHAWKQSCYIEKLPMDETPVIIENLTVLQPIEFHKAKAARKVAFGQNQSGEPANTSKSNDSAKNDLLFNYNPFSGEFAFADADTLYCTGKIILGKTAPTFNQEPIEETSLKLSHEDIYREFMLRGYDYGPQFQSIYKADLIGKKALIKWNGYWSSFLDAVTQLGLLLYKGDTLFFAHHIDYCAIDPVKHKSFITESDGQKLIGVSKIPWEDGWNAGGVLIKNAHGRTVPRTVEENVTLLDVQFVPYEDDKCLSRCQEPAVAITETKEQLEERLKDLIKSEYFSTQKTIPMVLSLLQEDEKSHKQMLGSAVNYFQDMMESDAVFNLLWNESILKPLLDIVVNNVHHHRLEICFYHPPSVASVKLVESLMGFYPFMQSNITVLTDRQLDLAGLKSVKLISNQFESVPETLKFDLLIFKNSLLCLKENHMLEMISQTLKPEGFALVQEVTEQFLSRLYTNNDLISQNGNPKSYWQDIFRKNQLDLQAYHSDSLPLALMLLQPIKSQRTHIFVDAEDLDNFTWVDELKIQLDQISGKQADQIVWLTSLKPQINGLAGLLNSLKEDYPDFHIKYIYNADFKEKKQLKADSKEIQDRCTRGLIANVYQNGKWGFFSQIHTQLTEEEMIGETTEAIATTYGIRNLSALEWVEGSSHHFLNMENIFYNMNRSTKATEICNVYYAALNFKDVMVATGRLPIADCFVEADALGFEFAGRTSNGSRVMGIVTSGSVGTQIRAERQYLMDVPKNWSLEEAATTPVVYTTAYYALIVKGQMKPGEKVLIHAGSGGVGLAAIAIALAHKCVVYTTVSTAEKRSFVQERFPSLNETQFLNSRSTDFLADILKLTDGQGVDIVLNSLAEDKLVAGVECVGKDGRFLEIGKYDMARNSPLGMKCFLKNISFVSVVGERLFQEGNNEWPTVLSLFEKGVADGTVKPLPRSVFEKENIAEAIRSMAAGKHKGKVLIKMKEEESTPVTTSSPATVSARRRIRIASDEVVVVTGGLGGLGLEVAQLLIRRGAKRLILTSRRGITTSYQTRTIEFWRQRGIKIEVSILDVSYLDQTKQLVTLAQSMGKFAGVFHLAVKSAAQDVIFDNETSETFNSAVSGKFTGAYNLDKATRQVPGLALKWFVVFSSVSSSFQYLALGNYSWANNALDNLVRERRTNGLVGNSIEWGPVGDVGILYNLNKDNNFNFFGLLPQRLNSVLDYLDRLLMANRPCVISCVRSNDGNSVGGSKAKRSITDAISAILGLSSGEAMDPNTPFEVYGIDSLIGVELRQVLERDYGIIKSVKELKKMTPMELQALIQE